MAKTEEQEITKSTTVDPAPEEKPLAPVVITEPLHHEAPGIAFTKLFWQHDGQTGVINLTCRANTPIEALESLWQTMIESKKRYGFSLMDPSIQKGPAKKADIPAPTNRRIANVGVDKKPAPVPVGTKQAPAPEKKSEAPATNGIIHAVKLEITPVEDGKINFKWTAAGHNFPDIYVTKVADKALELLQSAGEAWDESHLLIYGKYDIAQDIYYRLSEKKNSKGNPYKDIVEVRSRD